MIGFVHRFDSKFKSKSTERGGLYTVKISDTICGLKFTEACNDKVQLDIQMYSEKYGFKNDYIYNLNKTTINSSAYLDLILKRIGEDIILFEEIAKGFDNI